MTKILGLSGKAGSGKSTLSHFLVRNQAEIKSPWDVDKFERYSPSDLAKTLAIDLFGLRPEQVWGTEEEKQTRTQYIQYDLGYGYPCHRSTRSWFKDEECLTARAFLELWGYMIIEVNDRAPINYVLNQIKKESPYLAIIDNVRRPIEVQEIHQQGGRVIRLTRDPHHGISQWETALDDYQDFDGLIHNQHQTCQETIHELLTILAFWNWTKPFNRRLANV